MGNSRAELRYERQFFTTSFQKIDPASWCNQQSGQLLEDLNDPHCASRSSCMLPAFARDDGQFNQVSPEARQWFRSQKSPKTGSCNEVDGITEGRYPRR
jgi:hypothetical protein